MRPSRRVVRGWTESRAYAPQILDWLTWQGRGKNRPVRGSCDFHMLDSLNERLALQHTSRREAKLPFNSADLTAILEFVYNTTHTIVRT